MKKLIKYFSILLLMLCCLYFSSCSNTNSDYSSTKSSKGNYTISNKNIVQLNINNYTKYISVTKETTYTDCSGTTYWNFSGSSNIIYNDVVISYTNKSGSTQTCELTAFGSGQIVGSWYSGLNSGSSTITDVTGSVEIISTNNATKVQLSLDNYTKYINKTNKSYSSKTSSTTYWNFSGSSNVIYNNVVISYTNSSGSTQTCELTIFGSGQIVGSWYSGLNSGSSTITNVTGSVEF